MPETLTSKAAVTSAATEPRGVRLSERPDIGKIDLRGDAADRAFMSAVGRILDLLLPTEPCQSAQNGDMTALWIGPDQWLLTCPKDAVADLVRKLEEALQGIHASVTEITAGRTVFRLTGPNMKDVLAKGCPLDLHQRVVDPGYVAGSVLAKITVLLHVQNHECVDVYLGRSFADYLWAWFEEAGMDDGLIVD
jgi:sarcosine oxidase subunit gamma